ncbi:MAG: transposase [Candidatus Heimdallarchaeota archaeon]|nr:transposase [Candidatus Heimdallarchaeota archaeon]
MRRSRLLSQKVIVRAMEQCKNFVAPSLCYSEDELFKALLHSAIEKTSLEDVCESQRSRFRKFPTSETVFNRIGKKFDQVSQEELEIRFSDLFQSYALKHPYVKPNLNAFLAVDLHDEKFFGEDIVENQVIWNMRSNRKRRQAFRFATLSIVADEKELLDFPITLAIIYVYRKEKILDVLKRLLSRLKIQIKISMILMDGEFATHPIFKFLDSQSIPFISRGRYKSDKTYPKITRNGFLYKYSGKVPVVGHIFKFGESKRNRRKDKNILVLASTTANIKRKRVKEIYSRRFRIENNYRQAKVTKIRTTTRNLKFRWLLWSISHFLEVIWTICRYMHGFAKINLYHARQREFNRILEESLRNLKLEVLA